jgi:hypothetical protein
MFGARDSRPGWFLRIWDGGIMAIRFVTAFSFYFFLSIFGFKYYTIKFPQNLPKCPTTQSTLNNPTPNSNLFSTLFSPYKNRLNPVDPIKYQSSQPSVPNTVS